jgi:hypothetical protein
VKTTADYINNVIKLFIVAAGFLVLNVWVFIHSLFKNVSPGFILISQIFTLVLLLLALCVILKNTLQRKKKELIGKDYRTVNSGFHSEDLFRNVWATLATKKYGVVKKNLAMEGNINWADATIVPFLNEQDKP